MSFRFVAVRIHAEERNQQGSRFAGCPCFNENRECCMNCSCETKKAACKKQNKILETIHAHVYTSNEIIVSAMTICKKIYIYIYIYRIK